MSKLRPAKPVEVMRVLEKMGFRLIRQSGSHAVYRHPDGRWTTVPILERMGLKEHYGRSLRTLVLHQRSSRGYVNSVETRYPEFEEPLLEDAKEIVQVAEKGKDFVLRKLHEEVGGEEWCTWSLAASFWPETRY